MSLCQCQWEKKSLAWRALTVWRLYKAQLLLRGTSFKCPLLLPLNLLLFEFNSNSVSKVLQQKWVRGIQIKTNSCYCCLPPLPVLSSALSHTHLFSHSAVDLFEPERVAKVEEKKEMKQKKQQLANSDTKNWNKRSKRKSTHRKTGIVQINLDINSAGTVSVYVSVLVCVFPALLRFFVPSSSAYSSLLVVKHFAQTQQGSEFKKRKALLFIFTHWWNYSFGFPFPFPLSLCMGNSWADLQSVAS